MKQGAGNGNQRARGKKEVGSGKKEERKIYTVGGKRKGVMKESESIYCTRRGRSSKDAGLRGV
jgi:hypothetical protein